MNNPFSLREKVAEGRMRGTPNRSPSPSDTSTFSGATMDIRLDDLIATSGGSRLIAYSFENRVARFQIYHETLRALVTMESRSDTVYGRSVPNETRRARCRISLTDLDKHLFVKNGEYVPATEHEVALQESRAHFNLAYGRRTVDVRWMLALRGEYTLLAFLVRDLADLRWTVD